MDNRTQTRLNDDYLAGESAGRKDAAMQWGQRDLSTKSHAYATGYSDGYATTPCYC